MTRPARGEAGLTATEVEIDLMIIAVLAATAVWLVGGVLASSRAHGAAQAVAAAMQLARQYAISHAATYTVTLTGTTIAVTCTADCPAGVPGEPATPLINGATAGVPAAPIRFGPLGTAVTAVSVTVTYPGGSPWEVRVTEAGRIRTCSPTCS